MTDATDNTSGGGWVGRAVVVVVVWVLIAGGVWWLVTRFRGAPAAAPAGQPANASTPDAPAGDALTSINVVYGTEKEAWLKWAVGEFAKTDQGRRVRVNLVPKGSLEGGQLVVAYDPKKAADDRNVPVHAWTPASSLYTATFVADWRAKHGNEPVAKRANLALTPMVFAVWQERHDAFALKYKQLDFATLADALAEPTGWKGIADKPEWGFFKFGHTHPGESNSGLATLALMAYNRAGKRANLTLDDVVNADFQAWLTKVERAMSSNPPSSTKYMMDDMVLRGPGSFDGVMVYENLAIDYIPKSEGRWGRLRVVYPPFNLWNENPFYVLDAPWSDAAQKKAAGDLLDFLMAEPTQARALQYGFRPGNPAVPVLGPDSPFTRLADYGLKNDIGQPCDPPRPEVLQNLLIGWERSVGR